jgi:hypothetical protein
MSVLPEQVQMRHVVVAFAPIPLGLALALVGLAIGNTTLIYVSIAVSAIAMPVGGYAAARLFHQLVDEPAEQVSRRAAR